jgi:uncharacterized protein YdhG (YjbR/CyaY superfamily)
MKKRPTTTEIAAAKKYLASLPRGSAAGLRKLAASIKAAAPTAELGFSYGIPAFILANRPVVWFAAFEHHSSFFPGPAAIRIHAAELETFKTSKGTIQFPHGKPPSAGLVAKLVKTRISDMHAKGASSKHRSKHSRNSASSSFGLPASIRLVDRRSSQSSSSSRLSSSRRYDFAGSLVNGRRNGAFQTAAGKSDE